MTRPFSVFIYAAALSALAACGETGPLPPLSPAAAVPPCATQAAPAPQPFADEATARAVADGWLARHTPESMHWDWGPAVLSWALLDLWEATGDERYFDFVAAWVRHHAASFPALWSDTVAPAAAATRVAARTCEPALLGVIARTDDYLRDVPRTAAGGIGHLGHLQPEMPQLWVDSLFMVGSYWMARHALFGDPADIDSYAAQIRIFGEELQNPRTGLFHHALVQERPWPWNDVFWGRGNGWVAAIVGRFLADLPADHPDHAAIVDLERRLLAGVLATQDDSGLWWTVMNAPGEGYTETSASALFAYALRRGADEGWVDPAAARAAADRARAAVLGRLTTDVDGHVVVTGTSGPTQPGGRGYYAGLPQGDDIHYGVGSVILMLTGR
jgi:unsaturated rhamnogalacturonyl hydrolase